MRFDYRADPFLSQFSPEAAEALLSAGEEKRFQAGELLIVEGAPSDSVFILLAGELAILKGEVLIDTQSRRGTLGEMGVITGSPRSTTVRAESEVDAIQIDAEPFLKVVDEYPQLLRRVCHELAEKLRKSQVVRQEQHRELVQVQQTFERCVSASVLEQILESNSPEALLEGAMAEAAILFFDIRGFTSASETMSPKMLLGTLNAHLETMVESVLSHEGVINNFIGDAVMAVFNCPIPSPKSASNALQCALDCERRLLQLHEELEIPQERRFAFGIGLNFGAVVAGAVGSTARFNYTVLGDPVNLAARLEGLTRHYPLSIILSDSLLHQLSPEEASRCFLLDRVTVKGRRAPLSLYGLWAGSPEARLRYEESLMLYLAGSFEAAQQSFLRDGDEALQAMMARRCEALMESKQKWPGYYEWDKK